MRAYQVVEFGSPLVSRDLPDPTPDARAVVVDVLSCGLCHTDVHLQQGHIGLGGDQGLFGGALLAPLAVLVQRQLTLRGSYVGTPDELRELVALVRDGRVKPIPIRNEPIESVNDRLGQLRASKVIGRIVHVHRNGSGRA